MSELVHLAALFNPTVYKNTVGIVKNIKWETGVAKLLSEELNHDYSVSTDTLLSITNGKLIKEELNLLVDTVNKFRNITSERECKIMANQVFEYHQKLETTHIISKYSTDIPLMLTKLREIPLEISGGVRVTNLGSIRPSELMEEDLGGTDRIFGTNFQLIKECTPFNGYLPGQVVQVIAPPGVGKSAFILSECALSLLSGYKVLWIALGDLMRFDITSRIISVISGEPYFKVALNSDSYYSTDIKDVLKNFDLICEPSKGLTHDGIVSLVNDSAEDYDIVVIDYDSNVDTGEDKSMYEAGGALYDSLTSIARPTGKKARLVFVACQPNKHYWELEEIPMEAAGESARKQHVIDIQITLGKAKSEKKCGIMSIPKVRRGDGGTTPYMMTSNGQFKQINRQEYAMMKKY